MAEFTVKGPEKKMRLRGHYRLDLEGAQRPS